MPDLYLVAAQSIDDPGDNMWELTVETEAGEVVGSVEIPMLNFQAVDDAARALVAAELDVEPDSFDVQLHVGGIVRE